MSVTAVDRNLGSATAVAPVQPAPPPAAQRPPEAMLKGVAVQGPVPSEALDAGAVERAAARMEEAARSAGRSLQFRVDEDSGRVVVSVRDPSTGELIRQIPSEAALRIARDLDSGASAGPSLMIEGMA